MFWKLLTPDQWSALGTVVSALIAVLNLVVVIVLLIFTKNATESARAQAEIAKRTLVELTIEKQLQNGRDVLRTQGRLKDLGDTLVVLEQALQSTRFVPDQWKAKPSDWHEMGNTVTRIWVEGAQRMLELEQRLRAIDVRLGRLASAPIVTENFNQEKADLRDFVHETRPLVAEVWNGMMNVAT